MKMGSRKARPIGRRRKSQPDIRRALLHAWVGSWVTRPKNDRDRRAAELVKAATRITKAGSLISPVAVAAIDVLGMTALLETKGLEEVAERVAEPFFGLGGPVYTVGQPDLTDRQWQALGYRRGAGVYSATIADTIVLARRPDWELGDPAIAAANAVVDLAGTVCEIIKVNSFYGIWLRAAISYGECVVMVARKITMLGLPTREAAAWERSQDWIGGMLAPSAIEALRRGAEEARSISGDDFVPRYPNYLVEYPVPLKDTCAPRPLPSIALNWAHGIIPGMMFWKSNLPSAPDASTTGAPIIRKILNTREFARHCENLPFDTVIDWPR